MSHHSIEDHNIPTLKEMCMKIIIDYKIDITTIHPALQNEIYKCFGTIEDPKFTYSTYDIDIYVFIIWQDPISDETALALNYIEYELYVNNAEHHMNTTPTYTTMNYMLPLCNEMNEIKIFLKLSRLNSGRQLTITEIYHNSIPIDFIFINEKIFDNYACNIYVDYIVLNDDFNIVKSVISSQFAKIQFEKIVEKHMYQHQKLAFFHFFLTQCTKEERMKYIYSYISSFRIFVTYKK